MTITNSKKKEAFHRRMKEMESRLTKGFARDIDLLFHRVNLQLEGRLSWAGYIQPDHGAAIQRLRDLLEWWRDDITFHCKNLPEPLRLRSLRHLTHRLESCTKILDHFADYPPGKRYDRTYKFPKYSFSQPKRKDNVRKG
jgi:hypothetical protein